MKRLLLFLGCLLLMLCILRAGSDTVITRAIESPGQFCRCLFASAKVLSCPRHQVLLDSPIGFALDDGYADFSLGFGNNTYNFSAAAILVEQIQYW